MPIGAMIEDSTVASVVSNPRLPDNPIVACNSAFVALTGFAREEVVGRNCRFLVGPDTEPELSAQLRDGIASRTPVIVDILNYRRDGTPFRNAVMVAPIFGADGELEFFLGSQMEILATAEVAEVSRASLARASVDALSRRQREILRCIAGGKLNKQIAYDLGLSERTVKLHRAAVLAALGVRTSAEAIRIAIEAGL